MVMEENQKLLQNNQESFKNLIHPNITKNKYTMLNNSPSKKNFHFPQYKGPAVKNES